MQAKLLAGVFVGVLGLCAFAQADEPKLADLIATLKSSDEAAQAVAIDQLGRMGQNASEAAPALTGLLGAKSAMVRAHAAEALGRIGPASFRAVPQLIKLLADDDPAVRRKAAMAVRELRPGPAIVLEPMLKMIEDADQGVRNRVLHALAEGGAAVVPRLVTALDNDRAVFWVLLVLRDIGPNAKEAAGPVTKLLDHKRPEVRREALLVLGEIGEPAAASIPAIIKALDDTDTDDAAIYALVRIGKVPAEVEAKIRKLAEGDDPMLATVSAWALAKWHPDDAQIKQLAAKVLAQNLVSKMRNVRIAAARSLLDANLGREFVAPAVDKALEGAGEEVTMDAMRAFSSLGAPAVPRLIESLKFAKRRAAIAFILGDMGAEAKAAVPALTKMLGDADAEVRQEAAMALGKIGPESKSAVPALAKLLESAEGPVGHAAAFSLGQLGPAAAEAKPALLAALESKDESVEMISAWALAQIDPTSKDVAEKSVPVLIKALGDPAPRFRLEAARVLAKLGPLAKPAVAALKQATTDEDAEVRLTAAATLKTIEGAGP